MPISVAKIALNVANSSFSNDLKTNRLLFYKKYLKELLASKIWNNQNSLLFLMCILGSQP